MEKFIYKLYHLLFGASNKRSSCTWHWLWPLLTIFWCFPIVTLTLCLPKDGTTRIFHSFSLHSGNARLHQLLRLIPLPTTLDREGEKSSEYCNSTQICRWRELNPGHQHSKRERYPLHHCLPEIAHYLKGTFNSWKQNSMAIFPKQWTDGI